MFQLLRCFDNVPVRGKFRADLGHSPKLLLEVSSDKGLVGRSFNTPPGLGRVERNPYQKYKKHLGGLKGALRSGFSPTKAIPINKSYHYNSFQRQYTLMTR